MSNPAHDRHRLRAFAPALTLLAICTIINYADRGNLSVAAPVLKNEFGLSLSSLGLLLGAFFWSYTAMQFVIGWLIDRFDASWIIAAGFLLWSVATAATGVAGGFAILFLTRLMLGIGEAVIVPGSSKLMAVHLPEQCRGFANGVLMAALRCGNAVGTLGAGLLIAKYSWRPVFLGMGLISLLWLPLWAKWKPAHTVDRLAKLASPTPIQIMQQRSFWGAVLGHFAFDYLLYFMITWLPTYLVLGRHLSLRGMTAIATAYYSIDAIAAMSSGWLSDIAIRSGHSPTFVRKFVMALGSTIAVVAMTGCAFADQHTYIPWLMLAAVGSGVTGSGVLLFPQALAGPNACGHWTGLQNGFANFAGVIGPFLTGVAVDRTGTFLAPFAITAAVLIAGGIGWVVIVGPLEQVEWKPKPTSAQAASTQSVA
jgi:MFS family permease